MPGGNGEGGEVGSAPGPKRLVVCMDGTWNNSAMRKGESGPEQIFTSTNVLKACRAVIDVDYVTATLVLTDQPLPGETVTIGERVYTFQEELTAGDGHVRIGESARRSLENLRYAINAQPSRRRYSALTSQHSVVEARRVRGDRSSLDLRARFAAAEGDPFDVGETLTHGAWMDKMGIAAEYRRRGADPFLGIPQIAYYDVGVGAVRKFPGFSNTIHRTVERAMGGAGGAGFESKVEDAYAFLSLNFNPGDEIFIFGFSRGASTARGLARFIDWMGGVVPSQEAYWIPRYFEAFLRGTSFAEVRGQMLDELVHRYMHQGREVVRAEESAREVIGVGSVPCVVKFLGVWESVLAIGERRARPFVGESPPAVVEHARQALAIDERRADFLPLIWKQTKVPGQTLEQRWFAGAHSGVGGGYERGGLSNLALHWMLREARNVGLGLDWEYLAHFVGYPQDRLYESRKSSWKILEALRFRSRRGIRKVWISGEAGLALHPSVLVRLASTRTRQDGSVIHRQLTPYRPQNLIRFLAGIPDLDAYLARMPGLPEDYELPADVRAAIRDAG